MSMSQSAFSVQAKGPVVEPLSDQSGLMKKALDNLPAVSQVLGAVTDRFCAFQAQALNVHVDFALFQRLGSASHGGQNQKFQGSRSKTPA
jgi:hypothetical protein